MSKQQTIQNIIILQQQFDQVIIQSRFRYWMDIDLTTMQFKCLLYITQTDQATSKKLAETLGVTPAAVTGLIDRLISQDFVHRKENPDDRRFFLLQVTERGKEVIEKLGRNAAENMKRIFEGMNEEELDHVYLGLSAIARHLPNSKEDFLQKLDSSHCIDQDN